MHGKTAKPKLSAEPVDKPAAHRVRIVVFPGFQLLDATGPAQVFATTNDESPGRYDVRLVSLQGGAVASSAGIVVQTSPWPAAAALRGATLLIAGGQGVDAMLDEPTLAKRLRAASLLVQRCCSVCTGAFLLAGAGLLDGRRAVTHWRDVDAFRERFPAVSMQEDAIHVKDGRFYSSAGVTAGIDLCLSLVEEQHGRALALRVAKRLVVHMKRPGGQRQFSADLLAQGADAGLATTLAAWLRSRLKQPITVEAMAVAVAMSPRSLHRHLHDQLGTTPGRWLTDLRIEAACRLLESGRTSIKDVARRTGFQNDYNLRRAFVQRLGVMPTDYKARFG